MSAYEHLPKDPIMLLSFTNTQLRDNFHTLDDFCSHFQINRQELEAKLSAIDYIYDEKTNRFI